MEPVYLIHEEGFAVAIADVVRFPTKRKKLTYVVTRINVMEQWRGKGYGAKILDMILEDADREGVTLFLEPSASGGLSQKELEAWYERNGFTWGAWHMRRRPKKAE